MIDLSKIRPRGGYTTPTASNFWGRRPVGGSPDLERILKLPRRSRPSPDSDQAKALIALMTDRFRRDVMVCDCKRLGRSCINKLRLSQAWALYEIGLCGGLLGNIGVGDGKTILEILTPLALPDCRLCLLLVPPTLIGQLVKEYEALSQHFRTPSLVVHGRNFSVSRGAGPVLHVLSYGKLSNPDATAFIEAINPDTIVADEVDKLRNPDTATTSRVLRHYAKHPRTRFCGWSGLITDESIRDYAHLSALALRYGSPLPLDPMVVADWARAIDPSDTPAPGGALYKLCAPGEDLLAGFHRRLVETPGIVVTTQQSIKTPMVVTARHAPPIPSEILDHLGRLRSTMVRPDGEELVDPLAVAKAACELAFGFYYRWIFPNGEPTELIEEWLEARKLWNKELRLKLCNREVHLDSEKLCSNAAERYYQDPPYRGRLPVWKSQHWPRWSKVKKLVSPKTEAVRIDPYLVHDAANWGIANKGVIWYDHTAFGVWVAEVSGFKRHGGGKGAGDRIAEETGDKSIVVSVHSHGRGRDGLQRVFDKQLIANPPGKPRAWEQLLGRLHRTGQASSSVSAEIYQHTKELKDRVSKALDRNEYVSQTLGTIQKLKGIE